MFCLRHEIIVNLETKTFPFLIKKNKKIIAWFYVVKQ